MPEPQILFVTRKWAPAVGGMETYSRCLVEALGGLARVETIALPGRANGMPPSALALLLFPFRVLKRMLGLPGTPQVLHLGDLALWPLGLLGSFGLARSVAISAHGTDVAYHRRSGVRGRLYGIYLRVGARLLPRARLIANSRATAAVAAETGWKAAAVVPLAIEAMPAEPPDGTHDGTILFVGRLVERKGCGWFIREVLPLLPGQPRLLVAGTEWDPSERDALAASRVQFLGPLPAAALADLYRSAKCVVMPNIEPASGEFEGFGLVAPEAAAAGGLVLAARCGGLTDAVIDGVTGLLVESGNAPSWADAIAEISGWTRDARREFLARSQEAARARYNWPRVARETMSAYLPERRTDAPPA